MRNLSASLIALLLLVAGAQFAATRAQPQPSALKLRLINKVTRRPVTGTAIEVQRENGIRCIKAPCPSDAKTWNGATDGHGYVLVPAEIRRGLMNVKVVGYRFIADLQKNSVKREKDYWVIVLRPN